MCNFLSTQGKQASFNYLIAVTGCSCKLQLFHLVTYVKLTLNPKYKQELKGVLKIKKVSSIISCIILSSLVSKKNKIKINVSVILLDFELLIIQLCTFFGCILYHGRPLLKGDPRVFSHFLHSPKHYSSLRNQSGRYEKQSYLHL